MITLALEQGSPEWLEARLAIPTASRFGDIIQPKKLQYSTSAAGYVAELLAEWATGYPIEKGSTQAMERGTGMEDQARAWLEMQQDYEVAPCGFVLRSDRKVGGSPDGLVGEQGGAEIKCPMVHTHIGYLINPDSLADKYRAQVQGYLYLTDRQWWDVVSYHPTLPKVLQRIERDEDFQGALHRMLGRFLGELEEGRHKLIEMGVRPAPSFRRQADPAAWEEAAQSVRSTEETVREMYEPRDASEREVIALKLLRGQVPGLSVSEQTDIQYAIDKKDAHAVKLWTRRLERTAGVSA